MSLACEYEGCTVGETQRCALEHDPATCPHRLAALAAIEDETEDPQDDAGAPVLDSPDEVPSFPFSGTLGTADIEQMMASRYVTVVGILGDPEAGKTALLASLYLLVSNGALKEWSFADSKSLMGFESIARGAREWNEGQVPDQMTAHTEMADDRLPGFLHLRLKHKKSGRKIDLALPDLPGEWTKALVRTARTDRLEFLRSSDVIWLFIDGRALLDKEKRQGCITRMGQLVGRLGQMMGEQGMPRLQLVVTHLDAGTPDEAVLARLHGELESHGAKADVALVASFKKSRSTIKAGTGLEALLNATAIAPATHHEFWPAAPARSGARSYTSFRKTPS